MKTLNITDKIKVTAEHYFDDMGFKRTAVSIEIIAPSGIKFVYPDAIVLEVKNYDKTTDMWDQTMNVSDNNLKQIFDNFILKSLGLREK